MSINARKENAPVLSIKGDLSNEYKFWNVAQSLMAIDQNG
jgi:hypothetical protein